MVSSHPRGEGVPCPSPEKLLTAFGLSLFPVRADKRPQGAWAAYQSTIAPPETLARWEESQPPGYGIALGPVSDLVVVDTDTPEAEAWAKANLPPTPWEVLTGIKDPATGWRGRHRYYRYPPEQEVRNSAGRPVAGLDVRGLGGYVVAPGSSHPSGVRYQVTSEWRPEDKDRLPFFNPACLDEPARESEKTPAAPSREVARPTTSAYQDARTWLSKRETPYEGERNHSCYSTAAHLFDFRLSLSQVEGLMLEWNRTFASPLDEGELLRTVASAETSRQAPKFPKQTRKGENGRSYQDENTPTIEPPPQRPWAPPSLGSLVDLPEFQMEDVFLPKVAQVLRRKAEALQVPPCFLGGWYLGALATIFQGRFEIVANQGWRESLATWIIIGSSTGTGKGPAHGFIFAPVREWARSLRPVFEELIETLNAEITWLQTEQQALLKGSGADKSLYIKKSKEIADKRRAIPAMPTILADNATPEVVATLLNANCGRLSLASSESSFASTLVDPYKGNSRCEQLFQGWSKETIRVDRIGRDPIEVHNPHLTVVAATQPGHLQELLSDPSLDDRGAYGRILAAEIPSRVGYRNVRSEPLGIADETWYKSHITDMLPSRSEVLTAYQEGQFELRELVLDEAGRECLTQYRERNERRLRPGQDLYLLQDLGNKVAGIVVRLTGLLYLEAHPHASDGDVIPVEYLRRAINLMDNYYIPHALSIRGVAGESTRVGRLLEKLAHLVASDPTRKHWAYLDIQRKTRMKADTLLETLEMLEAQNVLRVLEVGTGGRGGRKKRVVELHPELDLSRYLKPNPPAQAPRVAPSRPEARTLARKSPEAVPVEEPVVARTDPKKVRTSL